MHSRKTVVAFLAFATISALGCWNRQEEPAPDLEARVERLEAFQAYLWRSASVSRTNSFLSSLSVKIDTNLIEQEIADPAVQVTKLCFALQVLYFSANVLHGQMLSDLQAATRVDHPTVRPELIEEAYLSELDGLRQRANEQVSSLRAFLQSPRTRESLISVWPLTRNELNGLVQAYPMPSLEEFIAEGFAPVARPLK